MRTFLIVLFACFYFTTPSFSQRKKERKKIDNIPTFDYKTIHYGFYLGVNQNDFKINYKPSNYPDANIRTKVSKGFNVGLTLDHRLHKNINLRFEPGLISNEKTIYFDYLQPEKDSIRNVTSTYLHLPLVLKFSSNRWNNVRPYVLAGISYDYNFSSNEDNPDDNASGEFRMKSNNFMYEIGLGIDIYLYYFKFSPSIRANFAINNELVYDKDPDSPWTSPVNTLQTRGVFLNFTFE